MKKTCKRNISSESSGKKVTEEFRHDDCLDDADSVGINACLVRVENLDWTMYCSTHVFSVLSVHTQNAIFIS